MSRSQSLKNLIAQVSGGSKSGKGRKKGRKGRKIGKGILKLSHSKWGSYAGLFARQQSRRQASLVARFCKGCDVQFHSRAAYNCHDCE